MTSKIGSCDEGVFRRNQSLRSWWLGAKWRRPRTCSAGPGPVPATTARERQITDRSTASVLQDVNTRMLAGAAVLVGVGAALGLAGIGVGAAAFVVAARRWYERNDLTPARHAKLTWEQARAAAVAGSGAWKGVDRSRYAKSAAR
jgi:hypothetical protein